MPSAAPLLVLDADLRVNGLYSTLAEECAEIILRFTRRTASQGNGNVFHCWLAGGDG
jgi:hypothetical protein